MVAGSPSAAFQAGLMAEAIKTYPFTRDDGMDRFFYCQRILITH